MNAKEQRPSPDELLAKLRKEESRAKRGKLKIFLGMSPGVGKTYAMLQAGVQAQAEGVRVVVAVAETHGRTETEDLLANLPQIPLRSEPYRGIVLHEMDLDEVLQQHPQLALVDELAHTNAPGGRHSKRYQDVLELLDAGIDVFTTLNVQHIESRVDVVRQITGVQVRETVPDSVIDTADEIQLVDLTPDQLRERLAEGKVYLGERAATAADHFFKEENLTALREMALRVTAEHVGQDLRDVMSAKRIEGPWKSGERLMVGVGPSPFSERLIRYTRRMAAALDAPWVAAHVDMGAPLRPSEKERLSKNLSLARQLGAEVVLTAGEDVSTALLVVAREKNVTQIIVGKPPGFSAIQFWRNRLLRQLIRLSGDIDVCVVRTEKVATSPLKEPPEPAEVGVPFREYWLSVGVVAALTAICFFTQRWTGYWAVALLYLALVIFLGMRLSRGAVVLAATLSALCWDFFFIPPHYTFYIGHLQDALMFCMYFLVALVMGEMTARLRKREEIEHHSEQRTRALYRLAQSVIESLDLNNGLRSALQIIQEVFHAPSAVLLAEDNGQLCAEPHQSSTLHMDEKERGVAAWAFLNKRPAGRFTDTLPEASSLHLPLATAKSTVGVLVVNFRERKSLPLDERDLLAAFADHIAAMIERYALIRQSARVQLAEESEKLYKTLFSCVSHELKTPLSVITAAASELNLQLNEVKTPRTFKNEFLNEIVVAAHRLQRAVDNLLDMSRIESGRLKLEPIWCELDELVEVVRMQAADVLAQHHLKVDIPSDMPAVQLDFGLMQHALANLLTNAAQYSPQGTEITVSARMNDDHLIISVADHGPGIPSDAMGRVFERFYRGPNAKPGGTGLGLSIVQGLMRAMGGSVRVENRSEGGTVFTLSVPVKVARVPEEP